jgi:hypothetical protein
MPFQVPKLRFGQTPEAESDEEADGQDDGDGIPSPHKLKAIARRQAGLQEARGVLADLPGPSESIHLLCTARLDLSDLIGVLLERLGRCQRMSIATLGYNQRNLDAMLRWLDGDQVKSLTLVTSKFHRSHKPALWEQTLAEFRKRGQRAAACYSHAKVVTLAFADGSRYAIEGSANLCGNGSGREQFCIVNDPGLHDWHEAWIGEMVSKHGEEEAANKGQAGERHARPGPGQ